MTTKTQVSRVIERGKPDPRSKVHFRGHAQNSGNMHCLTGAYHVKYSYDREQVTCRACLAMLKDSGTRAGVIMP